MSELQPLSESEIAAIHQTAAEIEHDLNQVLMKFRSLISSTEDPEITEAESFIYDALDCIAEFRNDLKAD